MKPASQSSRSLRAIAVGILAWGSWAGPATAADAQYSIRSIRAHLYHQETGRFADFDLLDGSHALWNAEIGEGDAKEPSGAILVLVEVAGSFTGARPGSVELDASAKGWTVPHQAVPLSRFFSERDTIQVPFLIYGVACSDLAIEARLAGVSGASEPIMRTIPFRCGE